MRCVHGRLRGARRRPIDLVGVAPTRMSYEGVRVSEELHADPPPRMRTGPLGWRLQLSTHAMWIHLQFLVGSRRIYVRHRVLRAHEHLAVLGALTEYGLLEQHVEDLNVAARRAGGTRGVSRVDGVI